MVRSTRSTCATVAGLLLAATGAWAGEFKAVYSEVSDPDYRELQAELKQEKVLESLAAELNGALKIPTDVTLTVAECDASNAFYNPQQRAIIICYELIEDMYETFSAAGASAEKLDESVENATAFFFWHEVGHALIHVLDLPTTGREEDAVDQLSTYVLAMESEGDYVPALDGAVAFLLWAQQAKQAKESSPYWDEHSLNEQRFFNIVCWVYGERPDAFKHLVRDGALPENRAERCPGEWAQLDKSWSKLLEPHLKPELPIGAAR